MSVYYEHTYGVAARDTGLFGQCRPSRVLTMLQEAATSAACEIHVSGPEMLEKYNARNCARLVMEAAEVYEKRGILL